MNDLTMEDQITAAAEVLPSASDFASRRKIMVDRQIRTFGVVDGAVIGRMLEVPRELFVPASLAALAYSDSAITLPAGEPGGRSRVLLPPMVLARMIEAAAIRAGDGVLDLAGASGYSAAVLAGLGRDVLSVDDEEGFTRAAHANFAALELVNAKAITAPLDQPATGSFDVILVNGAIEAGFEPLFDRMSENGRLVAILASIAEGVGRTARAVLFEKQHGRVGWRELFDATAPVLPAFRRGPRFRF